MVRRPNILWALPFFVITLSNNLFGAEGTTKYSIALKGTFTSTSKLYPTPDAAEEDLQSLFVEYNDLLSFGVEVRRQLGNESIEVGVGVEFLKTTRAGLGTGPAGTPSVQLPIVDGYRFVPIELTGYFIVPFSTETVKLFMGGGAGLYFGDRIYQVVNRTAQTVESRTAFGIHVLAGVDYFIDRFISLRGEMKFRDPQFDITSRFTNTQVDYNGHTYRLTQEPFTSRVNLDGLVLNLGIVLNF
jgi:opacity protein-like surface antigen